MCGICGLVNWGDQGTLWRMTNLLEHRGPDDSGVWDQREPDGSYIGLGSRRLSIQDLSPAGHMPMPNEDRTLWITYNGEVYNFPQLRAELEARGHRFHSHSDTEVILRLYQEQGPACVKRLNGMFAIAIWDTRGRSLFLARDHFGIKPFYYLHEGTRLAFSSEIKAILLVPGVQPRVDLQALHRYLTFLWVPDPGTMFQGIFKLPAGHYATFYPDGRLEITRYWDLTFPDEGARYEENETELVEQIRSRFQQTVAAQMISDVPVGAFLSAGLDSSSIVAMMSRATREPVRTYTITFPDKYRVGESTLDNPEVAARVAAEFGCDHHSIVVEPAVTDLLPKLVWHMDEPVADPALITAYLVSREARKTVTVLLSGVGGDELFAGYRKHYVHYWARAYQRLPGPLRRGLVEPAVSGLPSMRGTPFKGLVRLTKKMVKSASLPPQDAFLMNCTYLDAAQKQRLYAPELAHTLAGSDPWQQHRAYFEPVAAADPLNQFLYLDVKTFMVSLNLTYNDKMSMASSVEVRVPFLDWELAEWVAQHVPPRLKINGFWRPTTKYIFRKAMRGILPDVVLRQPKAGFGAPVDYWLANELRDWVDDLLSEQRVRDRGYWDPAVVTEMVQAQRAGRRDWSLQIWQLLTLELWLRTFVDTPLPSAAPVAPGGAA